MLLESRATDDNTSHSGTASGLPIDFRAVAYVNSLRGSNSQTLQRNFKASWARLELLHLQILSANNGSKVVCDPHRLQLSSGWIIGKDGEQQPTPTDKVEKFHQTGVQNRGKKFKRFNFHPSFNTGADSRHVVAGLFAGLLQLQIRHIP